LLSYIHDLGHANGFLTVRPILDHFAGLVACRRKQFGRLQLAISDTVKFTPADFVNLFSQLSFTNRDLIHAVAGGSGAGVSPSGVAATGAILASQAIDVVTKAIENVPSDLGGSVNRKYVVRRMEYLQGTVKDLAGLKESRDSIFRQFDLSQ
jgi:hypothetical protein